MQTSAQGLRVLVTAGAAGIGRAIANTFLEHGARVHVCDVDEAALSRLKSELPRVTPVFATGSREIARSAAEIGSCLG